jgi:hypothetical protein
LAEVVVRRDALRGLTRRKCSPICTYRPEKIRVSRVEFSRQTPEGSHQFLEVQPEEDKS